MESEHYMQATTINATYYKSHIAVVCSKISQTTKQKHINIELKKVWQTKALAFVKTQQATKLACLHTAIAQCRITLFIF